LPCRPWVAGLIFVLIFGLQGSWDRGCREHHIKIIFATPALSSPPAFVTFHSSPASSSP